MHLQIVNGGGNVYFINKEVSKVKLKPIISAVSILGFISPNISVAKEFTTSVSISGLVQVEAQFNQDYDGTDTSDFVVDEVDLVIEAKVHKFAKAKIGFIYEEDGTPLEIDEAFLTLGNAPLNLTVGQMYVPFGDFSSHMISDPLTLELAEAREKAAQVNFEAGLVNGSVYIFNGTTQEDAQDKIDHYGANIGFSRDSENISYDLGLHYISDLGDSDGVTDVLPDDFTNYIDAIGTHINLNIGAISLYAEYLTALDRFNVNQLSFNGKGAKPQAWNVELGYSFKMAAKDMTIALGYQGTEDALAMGLPETRYLVAGSMEIYDNTTLSIEYNHSEDYKQSEAGTDKEVDNFTFQIAVAF